LWVLKPANTPLFLNYKFYTLFIGEFHEPF
jgi:hypothetical protein